MLNINIDNIGIVNKVDIKIDGITVVGAKNDSGKSTISKVLGTSLLSMNKYKDVFLDYIHDQVRNIFFRIEGTFENNFNNIKNIELELEKLPIEYRQYFVRRDFDPYNLYRELMLGQINSKKINSSIDKMLNVFTFISNHFEKYITKNDKKRIDNLLEELSQIRMVNVNDVEDTLLLKFFSKSFKENLVNFHCIDKPSILIKENGNSIFKMEFDKENRLKNHYIGNSSIKNIAYIESPQIIDNLTDLRLRSFNENNTLEYTNQLKYMLRNEFENNPLFNDNSKRKIVLDKIFNIISGEMKAEFNDANDEVFFQKGGFKIDTINVATGIKSFSLIQLLLKNNWINEEMLLIIDEPEINLHPEWQVKYAEILVLIQKYMDCKIYINTHSSYIIEAIDLYSKKYNINDKTNYYILEGYSSKYLNYNFQPIFNQLNGAFDILDEEKINAFLFEGKENE